MVKKRVSRTSAERQHNPNDVLFRKEVFFSRQSLNPNPFPTPKHARLLLRKSVYLEPNRHSLTTHANKNRRFLDPPRRLIDRKKHSSGRKNASRKEAIDVVVRGVRATAERYLVRSRRNLNARIAVDVKRDLDKR